MFLVPTTPPPSDAANMMAAGVTILASSADTVDPLTWLIYNAGSLGIVFFLMATGRLISKTTYDRAIAEQEKEKEWLRAELTTANKILEGIRLQLMGQTIPAINNTARVMEQIPSASGEGLMRVVRNLHERLDDISGQLARRDGGDDGDGSG